MSRGQNTTATAAVNNYFQKSLLMLDNRSRCGKSVPVQKVVPTAIKDWMSELGKRGRGDSKRRSAAFYFRLSKLGVEARRKAQQKKAA